jgi:N utilization substance protein A
VDPIAWVFGWPHRRSVRALAASSAPTAVVAQLLIQEVPEVADGVVAIKGIARKPGHRTKVLVRSWSGGVDAIASVTGVSNKRVGRIAAALDEKVDVIPWKKDPELLIRMLLSPANVAEVDLNAEQRHATIVLRHEDPLTTLFLSAPENLELASELSGYTIETRQ